MSLEIIAVIPLLAGFGFLYWGSQLEDQPILKLMFQLLFIPLVFMSLNIGVSAIALLYGANTDLINELGLLTEILGYVLMLVGAYLLYKLLMEVKDFLLKKRQQKQEEMYG